MNETNEKKQDKEKRQRKQYAARGERSQKLMSFRLDIDLEGYLNAQGNKGRFINDLIRKARAAAIAANWVSEKYDDVRESQVDDYMA